MKAKNILLELVVASTLFGLSSCNANWIDTNLCKVNYKDADKYSFGNAELDAKLSKLNINWVSGEVILDYYEGDKIIINEISSTEDARYLVHYYLDESTLNIQYSECGKWSFNNIKKDLHVSIPNNNRMEKIEFNSVSSNINMDVDFDILDIDAVSGSIKLSTNSFTLIDIDTVSSYVQVRVKENIGVEIDTSSVSGVVNNTIENSDRSHKIRMDSVSGTLNVYYQE